MLLAVDIGNTTTSLALLKGKRIVKIFSVDTTASLPKFLFVGKRDGNVSRAQTSSLRCGTARGIYSHPSQNFISQSTTLNKQALLNRLRKINNNIVQEFQPIENIIICSVVPMLSKIIKAELELAFKQKASLIGKDIKVSMKNHYRNPGEVGQDRLVGAYAAMKLYGSPAVIIDFGTAITFDVVSRKAEYLGGIIVPGMRLSTEALFEKTALLPKIKIRAPRYLIGKDTQESILSGIFYGYGALCEGLIEKLSKKISGTPKVVITGGYAHVMKKFITHKIHVVDTELVFKGMELIYCGN